MSTIFLGFTQLTAVMIVIMSLLDDVPIMTIAYDHTPVSATPIRWQMPRILGVSAVLGLFSVVESFGLLLMASGRCRIRTWSRTSEWQRRASCRP
jgi:H+-transporting ATPase